ncbi:MAG: RNA polymerase sigma factor for flagellar operon FliA [Methyloprofundus sp.]|nr:MAG: RNA polymerase sigma factor for flagellar operon FliA [Methyloprofundus sp.]
MNGVAMYSSVQAVGAVDAQIMQYAPLVKRIAYHLLNKLPDSVLVDDLIQAGMLGLLESLKNYDPTQGASFETYAGIRIRGSMLDEVRRADWTPRSVHKKSRMVAAAIKEIENKTTQEAKPIEIAKYLGVSLDEYNQILQDSVNSRFFSVEELAQSGDHFLEESVDASASPAAILSADGFQQALVAAIGDLPERERLVVSLYYDEELNLREIGEVLGVSESRVSQISSQAMLRLRSRLADWLEGNDNS